MAKVLVYGATLNLWLLPICLGEEEDPCMAHSFSSSSYAGAWLRSGWGNDDDGDGESRCS